MTKSRKTRQKQKDTRVTAPLISWRAILIIFGIMYFLVVGQSFIVAAFLDEIPVLVSILRNYLLCTCVLLAVLFGLFWRYVIGKPLRKIAEAARKVAGGDFSIQIPPTQKKGRKNEIDVLIEYFNTMTRELASNEMLKSDFIANVSHEIKAPLSIIQSYTKALKDGTAAPYPIWSNGRQRKLTLKLMWKMLQFVMTLLFLNWYGTTFYPTPSSLRKQAGTFPLLLKQRTTLCL